MHTLCFVVFNLILRLSSTLTLHVDKETNKSQMIILENTTMISDQIVKLNTTLSFEGSSNATEAALLLRKKRQSGAGKYADSAKMDQTRLIRLWLQLFANAWGAVYIGGAHPLHHNVPKPVVGMFKRRIGEFLFPKPKGERDEDEPS
ncbi:uncharacterized protein LOC132902720 [Amyelois transitella]|uniref:uncharacterized protein LOC132902720 n=1 Tax=Amyelois transitella TaxID=680683 RepID=UPI00298FF637|nr:uncharacterized protein LOC132902720 [Amyelois transitella]